MRLQLKLGSIAVKSKGRIHLLRADVCKATTSVQAQAHLWSVGKNQAFPGHGCSVLSWAHKAGWRHHIRGIPLGACRLGWQLSHRLKGGLRGSCVPQPARGEGSNLLQNPNFPGWQQLPHEAHFQDALRCPLTTLKHYSLSCLSAHQWSKNRYCQVTTLLKAKFNHFSVI